MTDTTFWRIAEDARIAAQVEDAKQELKEQAQTVRRSLAAKQAWQIRRKSTEDYHVKNG